MSYNISNQRDFQKLLQYADEGSRTTPSKFGAAQASLSFTRAGYNPKWVFRETPEGVEIRVVSNEGRDQKVKVGISGIIDFRTNITENTLGFVDWLFNAAAGGAGTVDDSYTFVYSYSKQGISGPGAYQQHFRVLLGCLPLSATIDIPNRGVVEVSGQIIVTNPQAESTANFGGLTTPTFASAPGGTIITHATGGSSPTTINGQTKQEKGLSLSISREYSPLDSSGSFNALYLRASRKIISGTVQLFNIDKRNKTLSSALTEFTITRALTGSNTITISGCTFDENSDEADSESSDTLMEALPFTAGNIAIS